jgi:hypothetical protein
LLNPWLWGGVALALLIFLPNLIWQIQHAFIGLEFTSNIHARDIRIGRTDGFLVEQLIFSANPVTIPLWIVGLYFYFFAQAGQRYRALGWMFVVPLVLFVATKGRHIISRPLFSWLPGGGDEQWLSFYGARAARAGHYGAHSL